MPDVIVIGCGGGGAVIAKELGEQGLDVLVLEAGPWAGHPDRARRGAERSAPLTPEEDLEWSQALDEAWNHHELNQNFPTNGILRWGPADRDRPAWPRQLPDNMFVWQVAGVGGTTQVYLGNCPRGFPRVFAGAAADGGAPETHPFPFPYEELVPFYEKVEGDLPVAPAPTTRKENVFYWGAKKAGWPYLGSQADLANRTVTSPGYREQPNCILPPPTGPNVDWARDPGCRLCGHCFQGCLHPHGAPYSKMAKRSTLVSYVPMALATGRVTIRPNTFVMRILATPTLLGPWKVHGVVIRDTWTGAIDVLSAPVVVMAAGNVESPRLWLNSGLPDPSGAAGAGMTIHYYDWVSGIFPFPVEQFAGQSSAARFDFPGLGSLEPIGTMPGVAIFGSFLFSQGGFAAHRPPEPGEPWDTRGRLVGEALKEASGAYDRTLSILILTDDEVNLAREPGGQPLNGVGLSTSWPPDEHGLAPTVTYRAPTPESQRRRLELARIASQILREAGATRIHRGDFPPLVLHTTGTLGMGRVIDDAAEARAVRGLFVADGSALPNGVGGPNPTLSIQAVAARTAGKITERHFSS